MKKTFMKIGVKQFAKLSASVYGIVLIALLPFLLFSMLTSSHGSKLMFTFFLLILYFVMCFLGGILLVLIFNLGMKLSGGLDLEFKDEE